MRLSDAITGYFLDKRHELATTTVAAYRYWLDLLVTFLGNPNIGEIQPTHIKGWFAHLLDERGLSDRSVHDAWVPLSSLWSWAAGELDTAHIMRKVRRHTFQAKPVESFTQAEIRRLLDGAKYTSYERSGKPVKAKRHTADRDSAIILTLLDSGLRASELCRLTIGDYDSDRGRLYVREGKGGKDRLVFLGANAQKSLWRMMIGRDGAKPTDPLFPTGTGERIERNSLRHTLQGIAKRVGVKNVHPHRFRHTFAITFLRNGGNVAALQQILGHSEIEMSLRYARIAEIDIETAGRAYSPADNWKLK